MKLLIVLSIKDYQNRVAKILEEAGIQLFSVIDITGYKKRTADNTGWFGLGNGKTNSIALFSFTSERLAEEAVRAIEQCNIEKDKNPFPVRGYILDVEQFSDKSVVL
ncbi:MAG: hypothetical protein PHG27_12550 [Massilibacteroides sp.]|nr:hypothetical protein [Massilibacteroides sp.]MDD3061932.1 hypothetical protein [Massilibacteroides sp.]MDD4116393.1 hypothetical protein [Massilibacteroides sp.]MDD4659939.1 hypothetical protein [Massilibacteroides sp.]